ncbi:MAG: aminotransferase class I/II-fold pyridoxal phosphate-dependent enzyme [Bacteroidetes bacterium]|jgi:threonine aldolase|nr:aminotransferase class I/II-fold pyridoxal phosphate-dependent enzyme [Bacteroidota bacterium]MBT3750175.1 aminotransferase class I/II-fold pyridoxal phosphate-dependent enzyme [Bacteroidota bacterium]MBT4399630.1 aminotransferase class I/II-fold pyridoxal phosphate-dependent enzyme [Bacteroidota bacterium]MBT4409736.1 aminotransferase class I/II-fold pyridoxal phosphate-dependent enzyme [Bacteroidota bacterium]MBT7093928.1 aminotransferase class I/II-fold pyridoxal phosphate-dependent enzym
MIDLRSDTITQPTPEMLDAMMHAKVGDDVLGDDPSVIKLQDIAANMFGMEAALFCPSGTMTNQLAINVHTQPGDEVICHKHSHVYYYEGGAMMRNSGVSVCLLDGPKGKITENEVIRNINPDDDHRPVTSLVSIENTTNKGGGAIYLLEEVRDISDACRNNGLKLHLDGARLFNALVETGDKPKDYGKLTDSISICLSKGLGAPVGSLLLGNNVFIKRAKRVRKSFGGAMRQAGYLAAAGIYALANNISRLKDDNSRAKHIGFILSDLDWVKEVLLTESNILIFKLKEPNSLQIILKELSNKGIKALALDHETLRFVTHLHINDQMISELEGILLKL